MIRFVGSGSRPRIAPRGDTWGDAGDVIAASIDAIPAVSTLPSGTLVLVLPEAARGTGLLSAFGRRTVPRHARCAALLHGGYVDIGAEVDSLSRLDLVFGRTP